jgi:hypothetical protein
MVRSSIVLQVSGLVDNMLPQFHFRASRCRTLCADCHRKTPTYGYRLNNNPHLHSYTGIVLTALIKWRRYASLGR